jgi:hypothetical protein
MNIATAQNAAPELCIAQLKAQLAEPPRLVVFFASAKHEHGPLSRAFTESFFPATVIGCSTAGEIASGSMTNGSVVAMAIPAECARQVAVAAIEDVRDAKQVTAAIERLASQLGGPLRALDCETHAGLVLVDGLSGAEEALMDRLGDAADFPFIGGSAGDDAAFQRTWVSVDGRAYDHGAIVAVLDLPHGYEIVKAQSFRSTRKVLTATAVENASRTVREFDGQPAAAAYARAIGVPVADLASRFMHSPLGLMVDGEPYVRSPQRVTGDGAVVFYCQIQEGMELELLESTDIVADTESVLGARCAAVGAVAGLINFNCILRTLELNAQGRSQEYGQLFSEIPTIGFSTYGEEYMGHINQTATMLLLGADRG